MKNFLFEVTGGNYDNEGEHFFIQCERFDEAAVVLDEYFPDGIEVKFVGAFDDEEAEAMGYDTF